MELLARRQAESNEHEQADPKEGGPQVLIGLVDYKTHLVSRQHVKAQHAKAGYAAHQPALRLQILQPDKAAQPGTNQATENTQCQLAMRGEVASEAAVIESNAFPGSGAVPAASKAWKFNNKERATSRLKSAASRPISSSCQIGHQNSVRYLNKNVCLLTISWLALTQA